MLASAQTCHAQRPIAGPLLLLAAWCLTGTPALFAAVALPTAHPPGKSLQCPPSTALTSASILVVGSVNVDITVEVERLPNKDETVTSRTPSVGIAVGGKGANSAVAIARLSSPGADVRFVGQFGNDGHAAMLESVLHAQGVDVSHCGRTSGLPSGQGIVMLTPCGSASSIVVGGANTAWPPADLERVRSLVSQSVLVMLQREIPEAVNEAVAQAARARGVPVMLDIGGEDRPISDAMLQLVDYVCPNESELQRLTGLPTDTDALVVVAARSLQARGARHVLVTLGGRGAVLVPAGDGAVVRQAALPLPGGAVVDATAAGDAFRAAFGVGLVENFTVEQCLLFGAAAGAVAASRLGAVPSLPSRDDCASVLPADVEFLLNQCAEVKQRHDQCNDEGAGDSDAQIASGERGATSALSSCPYKFASRLNSMRERLDLWAGSDDVVGWIARQGLIHGLDLVDFNYPQHLEGQTQQSITDALRQAHLAAGAVNLRFPSHMRLGAFTNPDPVIRHEAVSMAIRGCQWASDLGASELVVWSAFDGYDYHFQISYTATWQLIVEAFRQLCDACPSLRLSLEFKPTDENTRFSVVPSTGAALLLANQVQRHNFGLTLDMGHLIMAGENAAQSVSMVAAAGKLFGIHLNDGHQRLGAEDGLMFGSVHPLMALEVVHALLNSNYSGHVYFDTFPRNEDPVREAEYNIRRFMKLWDHAVQLRDAGIQGLMDNHDAMGVGEALEVLDRSTHTADGPF